MDLAGSINFLSNEDTGKHACFELAPGFFIENLEVFRKALWALNEALIEKRA
jgi:hypothetical protein